MHVVVAAEVARAAEVAAGAPAKRAQCSVNGTSGSIRRQNSRRDQPASCVAFGLAVVVAPRSLRARAALARRLEGDPCSVSPPPQRLSSWRSMRITGRISTVPVLSVRGIRGFYRSPLKGVRRKLHGPYPIALSSPPNWSAVH